MLEQLISTPRTSRNESAAADLVQKNLTSHGYDAQRFGNNLMAIGHCQLPERQTLLLNAHIDTVKPASGWILDPTTPTYKKGEETIPSPLNSQETTAPNDKSSPLNSKKTTNPNDKSSPLNSLEGVRLYGLGSNDDGASLVSLMQTFYTCDRPDCKWNLVFIASAEEEVSGTQGMKLMAGITGEKALFPHIDVALVGEPTGMQPAVAEKGLMVIDATVHGVSGHAARNEGINAIYRAIEFVDIVRKMESELEISPSLGPVKMTVTVMNAGTQHNVIPDVCTLTIDCRSNELYSNQQLFDMLQARLPEWCQISARSFCLNSSSISESHPLIRKCIEMGLTPFGSPTLSDQALLPMPSFKMGPGQSSRSHTAQEYICLSEIRQALDLYRQLLC